MDSSLSFHETSTLDDDLSENSSFVDISEHEDNKSILKKVDLGVQTKQMVLPDDKNTEWNSSACFNVEIQVGEIHSTFFFDFF